MCKKTKGLHNRIDPCIKNLIKTLNIQGIKTIACCCGHLKYPLTILVKDECGAYDIVSGTEIPRKKRFYVKDKQGYYYIPEVVNGIR